MLRSVCFKNFVKFKEKQNLNFQGSGPFIFIGENGSGKSSVLEGIRRCLHTDLSTSFSSPYDSNNCSYFICNFETNSKEKERVICGVVRLPGEKDDRYKFAFTLQQKEVKNLYADFLDSKTYDVQSQVQEIPLDFCRYSKFIEAIFQSDIESDKDIDDKIEKFLQDAFANSKPKAVNRETKCQTFLRTLSDKVVFTFPLRSIGPLQWSKSDRIRSNMKEKNYTEAEERCEVIRYFLESKDSFDTKVEKELFEEVTNSRRYKFTLSKLGDDKDLSKQGVDKELSKQRGDKELFKQGGDKELSKQGGNKELSKQGVDKELSKQEGDKELSKQGGDKELSKQGGDKELSKQGGDKELSKQGGDKELSKQGSEKELSKQGGDKELSKQEDDKELPKQGGDKELSKLRGDKELSKQGSDKELSKLGGDKEHLLLNGDKYSLLKTPEGILEAKLFSILMSGKSFKTVILEEPERGMHPQFIERMIHIIKRKEKLVILTTHNPSLITPFTLTDCFVFRREDDKTCKIYSVSSITEKMKQKRGNVAVKELRLLTSDHLTDILFSRRVFFCEGPSDYLFLTELKRAILSRGMKKYMFTQQEQRKAAENLSEITFLKMNGKGNAKLCNDFCLGLNIKAQFLLDTDKKDKKSAENMFFYWPEGDIEDMVINMYSGNDSLKEALQKQNVVLTNEKGEKNNKKLFLDSNVSVENVQESVRLILEYCGPTDSVAEFMRFVCSVSE